MLPARHDDDDDKYEVCLQLNVKNSSILNNSVYHKYAV